MRLYLVQHGTAKSKDEDPGRHLTDAGVLEVERIATFLKPQEIVVEALWHSGKNRAAQTVEILAEAVIARRGVVLHDGLGPKDDVASIAESISQPGKSLFIVGHLPFLSRLTGYLLVGDPDAEPSRFQNAGVVCLEQLEYPGWQIRWIITPELL